MVSPENPTGEKGSGGKAIPNPADPDLYYSKASVDLGQGWEVRPFVKPKAGQTITIMDVDGPATIEHIWMATEEKFQGERDGQVSCVFIGTTKRTLPLKYP